MRERDIEQYLVRRVKEKGGRAFKWVSPGNDGVPDRIVLLPGGRLLFAELKAPGKKPTPLQEKQIDRIRKMGHPVVVIDGKRQVDDMLEAIL